MLSTQYYIIFTFLLACIFFVSPKKQSLPVKHGWFYLILILIVTFRSPTMADYEQYEEAFASKGELRFEPAFFVVRVIVASLGNYIYGFLFFGIISIWVKYYVISKYRDLFWAATLVYLSNVLIVQDMVAIRAGVAGSLLLVAAFYRVEEHKKKMLLFVLIAIMFHYTAAIFLVMYFMSSEKPYRKWYLGVIAISYLMAMNRIYLTQFLGFLPFIGQDIALFDKYVSEMDYQLTPMNIFNLLQMGHLLICVTFWLFINKISSHYRSALILLKIYTLGVSAVCWFAQSFVMAIRLSEIFFVVEILLIPMGFSAMFKKTFHYKLILVVYAAVILIIRMTDYMYWDQTRL